MNAVVDHSPGPDGPFRLNPALDAQNLRERFSRHRRLRIPDVLEPLGALALYRHLASEVDWTTFLIADSTMYAAAPTSAGAHAPGVEAQMFARANEGARKAFASLHEANRLFPEDAPEGTRMVIPADTLLLAKFARFVNSPPFLALCRTVTGIAQIERADIQATRFRPGHFTLFHSTLPYAAGRGKRLAAFEMNLTLEWKPEWGGLHEFRAPDDFAAEAFIPAFNLLDLFSPYGGRWISPVAPFATGQRLAISGWLYGMPTKENDNGNG